jgi:hypothetical protein
MRGSIPAVSGRGRSIYDAVKSDYDSKFGKGATTITQSFLRLESGVLGTTGSISFAVRNNENASGATSVRVTETRLAPTDNFLATEVGFYIYKTASAGATGTKIALNTFPNSLVYTGSGEAANLQSLYNGKLGVKINGRQIVENWDLLRHYRVGNAQKGILTAASGTGNSWDSSTWDAASYGFFPLTPQIEFRGQSKNEVKIDLPESIALAGTSSDNIAVLVFRGLLIQNGSSTVQR